jgi:hypothetical protein
MRVASVLLLVLCATTAHAFNRDLTINQRDYGHHTNATTTQDIDRDSTISLRGHGRRTNEVT